MHVGAGRLPRAFNARLRLVDLTPGEGCGAKPKPRPIVLGACLQGHVVGWVPGYLQERSQAMLRETA